MVLRFFPPIVAYWYAGGDAIGRSFQSGQASAAKIQSGLPNGNQPAAPINASYSCLRRCVTPHVSCIGFGSDFARIPVAITLALAIPTSALAEALVFRGNSAHSGVSDSPKLPCA